MNTFLRNTISKLYKVVSALVTATRDALEESLESIRETASLLYNRVMENMEYGRQRLKEIVGKEAEEEAKKQQQLEKVRWARSLVVSDLRSETKGSRFESG